MTVICLVIRGRRLPALVMPRESAMRIVMSLNYRLCLRGEPMHWEEREQ